MTKTKMHPLEVFERGRHGYEGATEAEFRAARELLWAAPGLLDACKSVLNAIGLQEDGTRCYTRHDEYSAVILEAAIAKAEGRDK